MELESFEILEERVETLLKEYTELKGKKEGLEMELEEWRVKFLELSSMVEKLNMERGLVKDKIEGLLKKVQGLQESISSSRSGANL